MSCRDNESIRLKQLYGQPGDQTASVVTDFIGAVRSRTPSGYKASYNRLENLLGLNQPTAAEIVAMPIVIRRSFMGGSRRKAAQYTRTGQNTWRLRQSMALETTRSRTNHPAGSRHSRASKQIGDSSKRVEDTNHGADRSFVLVGTN